MNLDFTEEQQLLRETVRRLCAEQCPMAAVRAMEDHPIGYQEEFWKRMGELGLLGLTIPEAYGGAGQSALEAAILYEELGRALAPSPHFPSCVMSANGLLLAGSEQQKKAWLPAIARGEAIVTPAWLEPKGGFGPRGVQLTAERDGGSYRLEGIKRHVPFAAAATRLLVLARTGPGEEEIDLFLVDPKQSGIELVQEFSLASDTQYKAVFRGARVSAENRLGAAGSE